ncbi:MAG: hypothetical protein JOZ72_12155 [Alphaproteobacteria bacterium]|nr:hypothetical protein [Alphaproteobacteria bacterium]
MAAIDSLTTFAPAWQSGQRRTTLALLGVAAALAVAAGAFLMRGGDGNAARYATMMVFRASQAAFLLYYLASPVARLIRTRPTFAVARQRTGLALGFVGMYAVFLGCSLIPDYMHGAHTPLATMVFCAFSAVILAAILMGERAGRADADWRPAWRAMEVVGVAYFWMIFVASDLDHMYGPHRPDGFYGLSLMAFVLALLVRFADAFVERYKLARS